MKILGIISTLIVVVSLAIVLICNIIIVDNANGKLFSDIEQVPREAYAYTTNYGLLLGTSPRTRIGRRPNRFFTYRIDAAEKLYKAHKIRGILISGDENSLDGINEVECMKDSLVARGVDEDHIILDGKGYNTRGAVLRAVNVYNIKSFMVISQKFHNERAIYLAEHLGVRSSHITGFNAEAPVSKMAMMTYAREYFARVKVFWDIIVYRFITSRKAAKTKNIIAPPDTIYSFFGKTILFM